MFSFPKIQPIGPLHQINLIGQFFCKNTKIILENVMNVSSDSTAFLSLFSFSTNTKIIKFVIANLLSVTIYLYLLGLFLSNDKS